MSDCPLPGIEIFRKLSIEASAAIAHYGPMKSTTQLLAVILLFLLAVSCSDSGETDAIEPDMSGEADLGVETPDMASQEGRLVYAFEEFGEITRVEMASSATTAMAIVNGEWLIRLEDEPQLVPLPERMSSEFALDENFLFFSNQIDDERWELTALDHAEIGTMPFWGQPITIFDQGAAPAALAARGGVLVAGFTSTWPVGSGSRLIVTSGPDFEPGLISVEAGWTSGQVGRGDGATIWTETDGSTTRLRYNSTVTLPHAVSTPGIVDLEVTSESIFWVTEAGSVQRLTVDPSCFESGACPEPRTLGDARPNTLTASKGRAFWIDSGGELQASSSAEPGVRALGDARALFATTATDSTFWWATEEGIRAFDLRGR